MKIFLLFLLGIWLSGAAAAYIIMLIRTHIHPEWDKYTLREYIIGFIGSWYTVIILTGNTNNNL
jgi:hypothetical protein